MIEGVLLSSCPEVWELMFLRQMKSWTTLLGTTRPPRTLRAKSRIMLRSVSAVFGNVDLWFEADVVVVDKSKITVTVE